MGAATIVSVLRVMARDGTPSAGSGAGNVNVQATCTGGYCGDADYLVWRYVDAATEGSAVFDATTARQGITTWPLKRGWYRVVFYFDDGYQLLALSAPFRVIAP